VRLYNREELSHSLISLHSSRIVKEVWFLEGIRQIVDLTSENIRKFL